jgi:hypothetical protein
MLRTDGKLKKSPYSAIRLVVVQYCTWSAAAVHDSNFRIVLRVHFCLCQNHTGMVHTFSAHNLVLTTTSCTRTLASTRRGVLHILLWKYQRFVKFGALCFRFLLYYSSSTRGTARCMLHVIHPLTLSVCHGWSQPALFFFGEKRPNDKTKNRRTPQFNQSITYTTLHYIRSIVLFSFFFHSNNHYPY